jgi:hypothetical protein
MPNATVRANAPASPKSANPASPTPEAQPAKHPRIIAAEIVAGFELEKKIKQIQLETDVEDAKEASKKAKIAEAERFARAYYAWLAAKAAKEEPEQEDDVANERGKVLDVAERHFMTTPAVYPDHVWQKIECFEGILSNELTVGQRTESILLLALGAIKQDIINLDLLQ